MKSILFGVLIIQVLAALCVAQAFDFFYFVQQWPASYCDTERSCCYPTTGKPAADFGIHGLWPQYEDGSYPESCDPDSNFDRSEISDLVGTLQRSWPTLACPSSDGYKFWKHEWEKHGTCSESVLDQRSYFEKALKLKKKVNLLGALESAGIRPDGSFYSLESIQAAIREAIGYTPGVTCNVDESGNSQLHEIYLCVNKSATNLIKCPVLPAPHCGSRIEFPSFSKQPDEEEPDSPNDEL